MPVQSLNPNGPSGPAAAAAQSVQTQQQANQQGQQAATQNAALIADAQKSNLKAKIANLDATNSRARAQEAMTQQAVQQVGKQIAQADRANKDRAEAARQFDKRQALNNKVLKLREKKDLFNAKSDMMNSMLESTRGLARNEDGTFKNAAMQANFDKLATDIENMTVERDLDVGRGLLGYNAQAIGVSQAEGDAKFKREAQAEFDLNRKIASQTQMLETASGHARVTLERMTEPDAMKAMNASLKATVRANGELTTKDWLDAFATAGGLTDNQRSFLGLMSSQNPGDNAAAIKMIDTGRISGEEILSMQASLETAEAGLQGSDGLLNPMKDSLAGGLESALPDMRMNVRQIANQMGRFTTWSNVTAAGNKSTQFSALTEELRKNLGDGDAQRMLMQYSNEMERFKTPQSRQFMTEEQRRRFDMATSKGEPGIEKQVAADLIAEKRLAERIPAGLLNQMQTPVEQGGMGIVDTSFGISPQGPPAPSTVEQTNALKRGLPTSRPVDDGTQFTPEQLQSLRQEAPQAQAPPRRTGTQFSQEDIANIRKQELAAEGFKNENQKTRAELKQARNERFDEGEGLVNALKRGGSNLSSVIFGEQNLADANKVADEFGELEAISAQFGGAGVEERAKAVGERAVKNKEFLSPKQAQALQSLLKKTTLNRQDRSRLKSLANAAQKVSDAQKRKTAAINSGLADAFPQGSEKDKLIEAILGTKGRISDSQAQKLIELGGQRPDRRPSADVLAAAKRLGVDPNGRGALPIGSRDRSTREDALKVQSFRRKVGR